MIWTGVDVDVDGVPIHVHRSGPIGAPAVVLAHGFSDDGRCWSRFSELLVGRFDVVAPDARNHGRSGRGPADPAILAADLAAVVRALRLHRPILVGHSVGASTVAGVAAGNPDLVGGVVLEDPPWRLDHGGGAADPDGVRAWIDSLRDRSDDDLRRLGREQHPRWPEEELDTWAPAKRGLGPRAVEHLAAVGWEDTVARIEAEVLVVLGQADLDAIATPDVARRVVELHERATVATVAGAGHNIRRENLGGFAEVVLPFLDAVVAGAGDHQA